MRPIFTTFSRLCKNVVYKPFGKQDLLHGWVICNSLCSTPSRAASSEDVMKFWFEDSETSEEKIKLWFGGDPVQDENIRRTFGDLVMKARNGELSHWENLSNGPIAALSFVILLDQFCRNIYRGTADSFSHDHKALSVTKLVVDTGKDKELNIEQRYFLLLSFMHAEDRAMQERSVSAFQELNEDAKGTADEFLCQQSVAFAQEHKEVVFQFGRFPKRNVALGRLTTPEEEEYIRTTKHVF